MLELGSRPYIACGRLTQDVTYTKVPFSACDALIGWCGLHRRKTNTSIDRQSWVVEIVPDTYCGITTRIRGELISGRPDVGRIMFDTRLPEIIRTFVTTELLDTSTPTSMQVEMPYLTTSVDGKLPITIFVGDAESSQYWKLYLSLQLLYSRGHRQMIVVNASPFSDTRVTTKAVAGIMASTELVDTIVWFGNALDDFRRIACGKSHLGWFKRGKQVTQHYVNRGTARYCLRAEIADGEDTFAGRNVAGVEIANYLPYTDCQYLEYIQKYRVGDPD